MVLTGNVTTVVLTGNVGNCPFLLLTLANVYFFFARKYFIYKIRKAFVPNFSFAKTLNLLFLNRNP